jgi:hypothetical protein
VESVTLWLGRKTRRFSLGAYGFGLAFDASMDDGTGKGWLTYRGSMPCMYVQGLMLVQVCTARNAVPALGCSRRPGHGLARRDKAAGRQAKSMAWRGCRREV